MRERNAGSSLLSFMTKLLLKTLLYFWMLGCTPFTIVAYFFLWYLPPFVTPKVVWHLAFYSIFQALSTLFQVPYSALAIFLSPDQKERDSAIAYRMTLEILGTLIGATLQGQIVASAHSSDHCNYNHTEIIHPPNLQQNSSSLQALSHAKKVYMMAAGIIGGLYIVGIIILFFGVKEKDPYALKSDKTFSFCMGLSITMKYGPYVKLVGSFLLISTAVQLEQGNFVLFCTQAAGLRNHFQYLVLIILVSAAAGTPFWQWFLNHFGKKMAAGGIALMIPFSIMLVTIPNLILAYLVAFVSGLSIAVALLLPCYTCKDKAQIHYECVDTSKDENMRPRKTCINSAESFNFRSMLPDVVDHFRVKNPHSAGHETIFYSSYVFFTKISTGFGMGISASSLEIAGYKPGMCKQSSSVVVALKILIGGVPPVLIVLGLFILLFYPISEKSRKETKLALEMLRKNNPSTEDFSENEQGTRL
ncbi:sphingosine-1-phosphate transporter MFSD2B isoform X3 [Hemicordylus capensis]|uniref:sphingosine-1-phosphate transporter MFSD2B isoform X3 n=1 Tax=Hemicordylus capensis TaxID=884348 RepID=UPI00230315F2|nr:sphingosine-1-phosphate transporter MFSD2B isoform X3 [Hemicordylus capensis]XP_053141104.1 sphingosine-1-phosphate transporter MFSD2B isoform X3 [Hemicordylus capensis]